MTARATRGGASDFSDIPLFPPSIVDEVLRSPGQPLDTMTRTALEPRLGCAFGRVRVHADQEAAAAAHALGARAFTVGERIVFADNAYAPHTRKGRHLLVHELTHVAQQMGAPREGLPDFGIRGDSHEREADRLARQITEATGPAARIARPLPAPFSVQCAVDPDGRDWVNIIVGPYRKVSGDHIHQVAARTAAPGAARTTATEYRSALAISTKTPGYADKAGQRVEKAINSAAWGVDYDRATPGPGKAAGGAARKGVVEITAQGETAVGKTEVATASPGFEDVKSFYKLREAGVSPDEAFKAVNASAEQLKNAGALPQRVPDAPRSIARSLQKEQNLSYDVEKALAEGSDLAKTEEVANILKGVGEASKVAKVIAASAKIAGKVAGPLSVAVSAAELATAKTTEQRVDAGIGFAGNALLASDNLVLMAGGGGILLGQYAEQKLNVSEYASDHGIATKEFLETHGVNSDVAFVTGGIVTVASTPVALDEAAAHNFINWFRH